MIGDDKMYICLECFSLFEDPKHYYESHGLSSPPYEHFSECPRCGGNYAETYQCDSCDEWITDSYVSVDNKRYCQDCYQITEIGD